MNDQSEIKIGSASDEEPIHTFIPSQSGKGRISNYHTQVQKSADDFFISNISESETYVNSERAITKSVLKHGDVVCFGDLQGSFVQAGTSVSTLKSDLKYMVNNDCRDEMQDLKLINLEYDPKQLNVCLHLDDSKDNCHRILNSKKLQNADFNLIRSRKKRLSEKIETNELLPLSKRRKTMNDLTKFFIFYSSTLNRPDFKEKAVKTTSMSQITKRKYFKCPQITKMAGWFGYEENVSGNEYNLIPMERFFSPFPLPMIESHKTIIEEIDHCFTYDMKSETSYSDDFYTPDTKYYRRISTSHNTDPRVDIPNSTIPKAIKSDNEITAPACGDIEGNYPDSKENQHQKRKSLFRKNYYSLLSTNTKKRSLTSDRCSSFASKMKFSRKGNTKRIQKYDYPYCAAKVCLTPAGASIDWICCDTCEKWYHQSCLRLKTVPKGDYECPPCSKAKIIN